MKVDKSEAKKILFEEASSSEGYPREWGDIVSRLSKVVADGQSKTFLPMLGTALLAKATNLDLDVFTLKSGLNRKGAYSARTLCKEVLAANAPRLQIDLGTTGREPLNNQPFFAEDFIHADLPVATKSKSGFEILLNALKLINKVNDKKEAKGALRAFLRLRKKSPKQRNYEFDLNNVKQLAEFINDVTTFVAMNSENGKRAQACAAGILEIFSSGNVITSRINDPDRKMAGDVNVIENMLTTHALEVRDKPVSENDIFHFIDKVEKFNISNAGVLSASKDQKNINLSEAYAYGMNKNINTVFFWGWDEYIRSILFLSKYNFVKSCPFLYSKIFERCVEMEVSQSGLDEWAKTGFL